mgnify:CR=1 FL=1
MALDLAVQLQDQFFQAAVVPPEPESVAEQLEALADGAALGWDAAAERTVSWPKLTAARKCSFPELKDRVKRVWDRCKKEMTAACAILDVTAAMGDGGENAVLHLVGVLEFVHHHLPVAAGDNAPPSGRPGPDGQRRQSS